MNGWEQIAVELVDWKARLLPLSGPASMQESAGFLNLAERQQKLPGGLLNRAASLYLA